MGASDFFLKFSKLARKNFGSLFVRIFSHENSFGNDLQKRSSFDCGHVGRHFFSNQSTLGAVSARTFRDFAQILRYFAKVSRVFTDFAQISANFARIFWDFTRILT